MEVSPSPRACSSASSTDEEDETLGPDQCVCCRRPRTQGSFFAMKCSWGYNWSWAPWSANGDAFRAAAEQGCRRCGFVQDALSAYVDAMGIPAPGWIHVWPDRDHPDSMRTSVNINISSPEMSGSRSLRLLHSTESLHDPSRLPWNIVTFPKIEEDPTCEQALASAKAWMTECLNSHGECQTDMVFQMPRRLLELSDSKVALRHGASIESTSGYACLSHCWGQKGPSIRLTSCSAAQLEKGIDIDVLPKTFSDAVKVCLQLGITYLWIDALCELPRTWLCFCVVHALTKAEGIYQDDLQDWKACASEMASIYENASVTIAASSAHTSDDGLRHLVKDRFRNILIPSTGLYVREQIWEYNSGMSVEKSAELMPLMSRAWVFQENQLSPRTLGFGAYQLVWKCQRFCQTEDGQSMPPANHLQFEPEDLTVTWHVVVSAYSKLQITYDSDRLPALAALAEKMSGLRKDDIYLAGLWRNTLLRDLQWRVASQPTYTRCNAGAPSWSWASVYGEVSFAMVNSESVSSVELLGISYIPDGPPHMGRSTGASLTIKGQVGSIVRHESDPRRYMVKSNELDKHVNDHGAHTTEIQHWSIPDLEPALDNAADMNETLVVLFLTSRKDPEDLYQSCSGLLLREVSATAYERIGWLGVSYKGEPDQWDSRSAFSYDSDASSGPYGLFVCTDTPLDKYMSTLPLKSVTII